MFYTYIYRDPERQEPFYVGKGSGKRAYYHLRRKDKHPLTHRISYMRKKGIQPLIEIIDAPDEEHALFMEEVLISLLGRKDLNKGPLLNLSDGGESGHKGAIVSKETRKKLSIAGTGRKLTEEHKKNSAKGNIGKKRTPEQCENISKAKKNCSNETRLKISCSKKGKLLPKRKPLTQEQKDRISQGVTEVSNKLPKRVSIASRSSEKDLTN